MTEFRSKLWAKIVYYEHIFKIPRIYFI